MPDKLNLARAGAVLTSNNISEPITSHAINRGTHSALIDATTGEVLSYIDLEKKINETVYNLDQLNIGKKSLIGVALNDSVEHIIVQMALARIGAIHLPLDWRWAESEIQIVVDKFSPERIIVDSEKFYRSQFKRLLLTELFESVPDSEFKRFQSEFKTDYDLSSPLLISLSSGTTGTPTGPTLNHGHMISRFIAQSISLKFSWHDRFLAATPLYFGGGRTFVLSTLFMGGTVILDPPPWKVEKFIKTLKTYSPSLTFLVPTQIRDLLSMDKEALKSCSALSTLISSGSPLHKHERLRVIDNICSGLIEYYASTEGGGISALFADQMENFPDSVGKPIYRVEISITDENGSDLPRGQIGQIRYRGPAVASFKCEENTGKYLNSNGDEWFYPGDLGELDQEGFLYLRGRAKDLIIRGGINIYPQEIERVISQFKSVQEVCVFGFPDAHYGEIVAAALITKETNSIDKIKSQCNRSLSPYKVPSIFFQLNELPKNSGGKIEKNKLIDLIKQDKSYFL